MIKKIPVEFYPILKEDDLVYERVEETFALSIGIDDIYITDNDGHLLGILSKRDYEAKRPMDIKDLVKSNPIVIQTNKYEYQMAEALFEKSVFVTTVPVINQDRVIKHFYVKSFGFDGNRFVGETELHSIDEYSRIVNAAFEHYRGELGYAPYILTDIFECGGGLWPHLSDRVIGKKELNKDIGTVLLAYIFDYNALEAAACCLDNNVSFVTVNPENDSKNAGITPYYKMDKPSYDVLYRETCLNSGYFDSEDFCYLFQAIQLTERLDGDYVEIGTYKGDSARAALAYMRRKGIKRKAFFLDTYEGFSYDGAKESADSLWADTHTDTSIEFVRSRLREFENFELIKTNIITNEIPRQIEKIVVCNIDVDMYEAVDAALEKVLPYMVSGGVIIAEDYGHTPALLGAHIATDKFYKKYREKLYGFYMLSGQFVMIKK